MYLTKELKAELALLRVAKSPVVHPTSSPRLR
ncbi:hypothetical protein A2U01_0116683, partial [Trifolium medium]|nr:hypothetical protein [Trifolium medium]